MFSRIRIRPQLRQSTGSALFLIWSHQRSSDSIDGRYRLGHELSELADTPGEHVVLVKLNYWIGL